MPITTTVVRSNPVRGEVYSIQHYVKKFVSVCDNSVFSSSCTQVSSTSKTDRHDKTEILLKVALNTTNPPLSKLQWKILLFSVNIILYYYFIIENSGQNIHRNATGIQISRIQQIQSRKCSVRLVFFCCLYSLTTYFTFLTVTWRDGTIHFYIKLETEYTKQMVYTIEINHQYHYNLTKNLTMPLTSKECKWNFIF